MAVKRNIIANYTGQIYTVLAGICIAPIYLYFMGEEAYGLIGFFVMMQGWMQLMDMGLGGTLSRQVASCRAGGESEDALNELIRSLAGLFIFISILLSFLIFLARNWIASGWLTTDSLPVDLVANCITLMGVTVALRWVTALYRGIITGAEKQVWLCGYTTFIVTVRYGGALPLFIFIGSDPLTFFTYQMLAAVFEFAVLWWKSGSLLPGVRKFPIISLGPLIKIWHFSGAMVFSSVVWVFVTQTDKLILSKTLSLVVFGHFSLAIMIARGVMLLAGPISSAIIPRLTYFAIKEDIEGFNSLYCRGTQMVSAIVWPTAGMAAFFAEPLMYAWTGDVEIARQSAPILFWYALGNACLGVASFQYYMQVAYGELRLHVIGMVVFIIILIPSVIWASIHYGAVGAGRIWFTENLLFLLCWAWVVHNRFAPRMHWKWISRDVLPNALLPICISYALSRIDFLFIGRLELAVRICLLGLLPLTAALLVFRTNQKKVCC